MTAPPRAGGRTCPPGPSDRGQAGYTRGLANVLALLGAALFLTFCVTWWHDDQQDARDRQPARDAPERTVAAWPSGERGTLTGRVKVADAALTAPITGRAAVYYQLELGRDAPPERLWRATERVDFLLVGATGTALIEVDGAKLGPPPVSWGTGAGDAEARAGEGAAVVDSTSAVDAAERAHGCQRGRVSDLPAPTRAALLAEADLPADITPDTLRYRECVLPLGAWARALGVARARDLSVGAGGGLIGARISLRASPGQPLTVALAEPATPAVKPPREPASGADIDPSHAAGGPRK